MSTHDDLPPPPKMPHTDAPAVKSVGLLLGSITDWIGIAAAWHFVTIGKLSAEVGMAIIVGLCTGTVIDKLRGKPSRGGSTTALLVAGASKAPGIAKLLGALGIGRSVLALALAFGLGGCAGSATQLSDARGALNVMAQRLGDVKASLLVLCGGEQASRPSCVDAVNAYNALAQTHALAQTAIDVAEATQ